MTRFLENPRIVAIAALLVVVAGMAAMGTIVRQEDPTITNGIALIITPYPGASAERVESLVTERIEEELQTIREIEELRSTSRAGISIVTVLLDETLIGEAATAPIFSKVRDAIGDVQDRLPTGAGPSIIDDERFGAYTVIYGLRWEGGDALPAGTTRPPLAVMRRTAERLEELLRGVKGSDHARVFGGGAERIHVLVDTAALAAAGLRPQDVARALAGADAKVAAGVLRGPGERMVVEVSGELDGAARVRAVPLGTSPDGRVLRVADIAQVERGLEDPPRERARVDGAPGILVGAQLAAGQRFDLWRERVEARVAPLRAELPDGVSLDLVFDQTLYTQERLSGLLTNLVTGLALVVTVLFVTLGVRAAFLVTLALPLVTLASLAVLRFLGVPIHQMSVTGLIVALGLLVDNAIVVVDAVGARRREGMSGPEAVKVSLHHLAVPLFASTLTTVLAFMPILLLPGRVGEFVGTIGLSVIVALLASYIAAMTLVAAMAGRFLSSSEGRFSAGFSWPRGGRWFAESIRQSLARPRLSIVVAGILPLLGFVGALTVPQQFFPPADRDQLHLELRMAPASSFAETERAVDRVEAILRARPEVKEVSWTIGRSAPPIYYNMRQSQDGNPAYAQALIRVGSVDDVSAIFDEVQRQVNAEVPDAQIILRELLQGPPVDAPVEYRIHGPDPEILRTLGEELRLRMSRVPSIIHSTASLTKSTPKLRVEVDEDAALLAGLRGTSVAGQLQLGLEGVPGGSVVEGPEEVPVWVRARAEDRGAAALRGWPLLGGPSGPDTVGVPLSAVASSALVPVIDGLPRQEGERVNVVRGFTSSGVFPESAFAGLKAELDADPVPLGPGYRMVVGGDAAERADALADLFASVPVLILLMVASVALSLNSFRLAAVIFVVAFQAMGFGLLSLSVLRLPLGFNAMIGVIGLVGIAINAGIVIFSALRAHPGAVAGDPEAIHEVVVQETSRHIISTTITTFGGFLPLLLSPGGFWPPFASVIGGGVLLATIGSFYFVPAAFLLLTRGRPVAGALSAPSEDEAAGSLA